MNSMGLLRSGTTNRSMVCCGRASIREGEGIEMSSIPQVEVLCSGRLVGPMALAKKGLCACEYSSDWLRDGFSISPFELPIHKGGAWRNQVSLGEALEYSVIVFPMAGVFLFSAVTSFRME